MCNVCVCCARTRAGHTLKRPPPSFRTSFSGAGAGAGALVAAVRASTTAINNDRFSLLILIFSLFSPSPPSSPFFQFDFPILECSICRSWAGSSAHSINKIITTAHGEKRWINWKGHCCSVVEWPARAAAAGDFCQIFGRPLGEGIGEREIWPLPAATTCQSLALWSLLFIMRNYYLTSLRVDIVWLCVCLGPCKIVRGPSLNPRHWEGKKWEKED